MYKIYIITLILIITGCDTVKNVFPSKVEPKLPGERINIAKTESLLEIDKTITNLKINIPEEQTNYDWNLSEVNPNFLPENIKFVENFKLIDANLNLSLNKSFNRNKIIIVNNIIYVLNKNQLIAYNVGNFKIKWNKKLYSESIYANLIGGGLSYTNGKIIITSGDRRVIAVSIENGDYIWNYELDNISRAMPIVEDDKVFIMTIDNRLYALSNDNGKLIWIHEGAAGEEISIVGNSSVASANGILIVPHSSGHVYALRSSSGEEIWSINLSYSRNNFMTGAFSDVDITPVISQDKVFIYNNAGLLHSVDLISGNLNWKKDIKDVKSLWILDNFLFLISENKNLICIESKEGKIKWIKDIAEKVKIDEKKKLKSNLIFYGPIIAKNNLLISSNQGKLLVVSPDNGDILAEKLVPNNVDSSPIIVKDKMFLQSKSKLSILE